MFSTNISGPERILRLLVGGAFIWGFALATSGFLMWIGIVIGLFLVVTGALGFDQLYVVLGINTKEPSEEHSDTGTA
jgi:hypothetical protein